MAHNLSWMHRLYLSATLELRISYSKAQEIEHRGVSGPGEQPVGKVKTHSGWAGL